MAPSLTFYFAPGASSMAPHIALHEIGVNFEAKPVSLAKRESREPAFLALNPAGQVPLLVIDGRPLTEVAGILFYLARAIPAARLLPEGDPEAEAQVVSWMSFVAATLHPWRHVGVDRARSVFGVADQRLGAGPWAVGDYSIADIHLFRLYWRLRHSLDLEPGEFPRLADHYDRMMERPAVRQTCEIEAALGYELQGFTPPGTPAA